MTNNFENRGGAEYGLPPHQQPVNRQPTMRPQPSPEPAAPEAVQVPRDQFAPQYSEPAPVSGDEPAASAGAIAAAIGTPLPEEDVVVFSRPYKAHDLEVRQVKFREPTGRDIETCGYPFRLLQPEPGIDQVEIKIIPQAVTKLIVTLSNPPLPKSTVDQLSVRDWNACSTLINGFFQR